MTLAKNNSMTDSLPTKGTYFFILLFLCTTKLNRCRTKPGKNFRRNRKCSLKCNYKLIEPISEFVTFRSAFIRVQTLVVAFKNLSM